MKAYQSAFQSLVKKMQKTIYLAMDKESNGVIKDRLNNQSELFFSSRLSSENLSNNENNM